MSRGARREDIFWDDIDRLDFLKSLAKACQQTGNGTAGAANGKQKAEPDQDKTMV